MLDIKIKPTHDNFKHPIKGSEHAACWDVYAAEIAQLNYNKYEVNLGFATEIPDTYKGVIVPRSSITKANLIMQNSPAQIDSDYRGDWKVVFKVLPTHKFIEKELELEWEFPYNIGDRVAQIYFEEVKPFEFNLVSSLPDSDRGTGGFGSSGNK